MCKLSLAAVALTGLVWGVAGAQNPPGGAQNQRTGPAQGGQTQQADQQVAACVYGECSNEIEIAKWAESKLQTDEAREFAQRMVREHTPGCQQLQQKAGSLANDRGSTAAGGGLDWVGIHKQIGEQCLASVKKELGEKQGIEFDQCFIGQQMAAHMKMIDSLKVLRNQVSSDFQQSLDKELQLSQTHFQQAKQIAKQIKDRPSERVSRRPESK